jgi:hypothetical protein
VALEDWSGGSFTTAAEIRVFGKKTNELGDTSTEASDEILAINGKKLLKDYKVYPNPTNDYLNSENLTGAFCKVYVYNPPGSLLKSFEIKDSYKFDMSIFTSVIYFLEFKNKLESVLETIRIIKI